MSHRWRTRIAVGALAIALEVSCGPLSRAIACEAPPIASDHRAAQVLPVGSRQEDHTDQPEQRRIDKLLPNRPHQVGYRRLEFRLTTSAGDHQTRQLDVWYPTRAQEQRHNYRGQIGFVAENGPLADGAFPLLLFSHGLFGMSDQSIFLMEACGRAGYIVAAMNHADSLAQRGPRKWEQPRLAEYARWTDDKYRARKEDLVALLDQLLEWNRLPDSPWHGHIDEQLIGAMGHSLGGYTVLGMVGGWPSWKDARLKCLVLFSPFGHPLDANGDLSHITVPVMLQGGTLDVGITPFLPSVYQKLGGPKVLLIFKNETHFGWTNLICLGKTTKECAADGNSELMVKYTIAFFDQYLLRSDQSQVLSSNDRLQSFRSEPKSTD